MKIPFFLFLCFLSSWGFPQNRVVKDNLACLYGIKNADGVWVVRPKYQLLTGYSYGYFLVQEGADYGLLAQDGTELIKCEYSRIKPLNYSWHTYGVGQPVPKISTQRAPILFQVEKNEQRALVDSLGETVVPMNTQFFRMDGPKHVIITEYRNPNHFTSYIDSEGNYLFKGLPGAIEPFGNYPTALIGLRTPGSNGTVEGNVRVINKKGDFVIPDSFQRALICGQGRIVFEDSLGHIGTMDLTGRIFIQPKYKLVFRSYTRKNILPCLYSAQHSFVIQDDAGKLGLMNGAGKIICLPKFEQLEKLTGGWKTDNAEWRIREKGKVGFLDKKGSVSIPCLYDTLIPFRMQHGRNSKPDGYIVSDDKQFGLINLQGDTIIPLKHAFFRYAYRSHAALFGNLRELSQISLLNDTLHIAPVEKLLQLADHTVFRGQNDDYFVLKEAENSVFEVVRTERYMNVTLFRTKSNQVILLDSSGKRLEDGSVHGVYNNLRFIEAKTNDESTYLIDTKTAKIITEPAKNVEFQLQGSSMTLVWSKGLVAPKDSWILLDTNGRKFGNESFDHTFNLNAERVTINQGGYWGVYDVQNGGWLLAPKYTCIDELSELIYKAKLQNGQWELSIFGEKSFVNAYESLELLANSSYSAGYASRGLENVLFLVTKNGVSFLLRGNGERITDRTEMKHILMEIAYGVNTSSDASYSAFGSKIKQSIPDFRVTALYEQLYDMLANQYPKPKNGLIVSAVDKKRCSCPVVHSIDVQIELFYATPNAVTAVVSDYVHPADPWDVGYYETRNYINAILVKGEMKQIELAAIFGHNNQLLYNEFVLAIKADETLDLECSTVSNMLELVRNNYKFSPQGLVLIVQQNSKQSVDVLIPWERLLELSTTRSFAQLFRD